MIEKTPLQTKNHYEILDGLRGVAAICVVLMHVFETFAGGNRFVMLMNHGYLAVDFFFLLSGFVVAYAYDNRWGKMTTWEFYKRRLIRLQPMVIIGSLVGAALFYLQASPTVFPLIAQTPVWQMLLVMLVGATLLPLPISADIRGWQEMHPLNGPGWSLFFEYIANILYAVILRRLPKAILTVLVVLFACQTLNYGLNGGQGDFIGGWAIDQRQLTIGFTRVLYPFTAGLLLCRVTKLVYIKGAFLICSVLLIITFALPRFGDEQHLWINGLYEALCVIIVFPLIVWMGAGGSIKGEHSAKLCKFLGDVSYPLYITHYPLIYVYTAWVVNNKIPLSQGWIWGLVLLITAVTLAYAYLKLYDEPVRKWLTGKYLSRA